MARRKQKRAPSGRPLSAGQTVLFLLVVIAIAAYLVFGGDELLDEELSTPTPAVVATDTASAGSARGTPSARRTATPGGAVLPVDTPAASAPGWFEVFFTRPIYPDRPEERGSSPLLNRFVQLLSSATSSIDVAVYELDLPDATTALIEAARRGVRVRVVTDSDSLDGSDEAMTRAYSRLRTARIPIIPDERSAIMHHKFVVVDGRWVWTGSWNFTLGDTYRLNNNGVLIDSRALAANYEGEFNRMFERGLFGPSKGQGAGNPELLIDDTPVRSYFSPVDSVADALVELVSGARSSVYFMAFQFTQDNLGEAMAASARRGVTVSGVFERLGSDTEFSEFGRLRDFGVPVYQDGNPYIMHHKVIVVDERTVVFGSYNFSANAERSNDENVLIVDSPALAARFLDEFNYVRGVALAPR